MFHDIDSNLIKKYDTAGPRYTSYPTAPHFKPVDSDSSFKELLITNNRSNQRDLSLYFHLPFCDTLCWFCACTSLVTKKPEVIDEYLSYLYREIALVHKHIHKQRKVIQLHFGGGTPTHLNPDQIKHLGSTIHHYFSFAENPECSCEMDPRGLNESHILALKEIGFNRASIGIQDFNSKVQKAINRIHSFALLETVFHWLRKHGFQSINVDLVYGLPWQTINDFTHTLEKVSILDPDRLAVFNYAHVPWIKPHQKLIKADTLPSAAEKIELLKLIITYLIDNGYVYIGMDHFAKANDDLSLALKAKKLQRNFQGYSTKAGTDIHAFGMSAISQLENAYGQNYKDLKTYYALLQEDKIPLEKMLILNRDDHIRRYVISRLMCDFFLDFSSVNNIYDIAFGDYFAAELERLKQFQDDQLLTVDKNTIRITNLGRLFIRNIAMIFDKYLPQSSTKFSKTL